MQTVIVGQMWVDGPASPSRWLEKGSAMFPNGPIEISLEEAAAQVAKHFNCTVENATKSLLKHGYASEPYRHWAVKSETIQGVVDTFVEDENGRQKRVPGDRWWP